MSIFSKFYDQTYQQQHQSHQAYINGVNNHINDLQKHHKSSNFSEMREQAIDAEFVVIEVDGNKLIT